MSSGEHHDPIDYRGMCLVQTKCGYKHPSEIKDACVPVYCRECSIFIPQIIMDQNGGQCMNCAGEAYSERASTWTHGYLPNQKTYTDRKQAYDTVCGTLQDGNEKQRIESKERQALIQQIVGDGGTVWNIVTLLLAESKQTPKGPWRIVLLADSNRIANVVTCRSLHDIYIWFYSSKYDWKVGYEDALIELADRYDRWKQGEYAHAIPDFLELFFVIVMKITILEEAASESTSYEAYDYHWTHIMIGESRMIVRGRPNRPPLDDSEAYWIQAQCASCDDGFAALDPQTPSGPAQCEDCAQETMDLIQKSGLQRDLERIFYTYLFVNSPDTDRDDA